MADQNLNIQEMNPYGRRGKRGNLLGIEPYLVSSDYLSAQTLTTKLDGYLAAAKKQDWLNDRTIVVWPEYIGTWLSVSGETPAPTLAGVVQHLIKAHPQEYQAFYASATEQNKVYAALFRTKAAAMADAYQSIFSKLAKKYAVTTVAGSIVLPSPHFMNGKLALDVTGPLYNVSAVFDPQGKPFADIVYKAYPTSGELPYTAPAPVGNLPAFDTTVGRLGVLICADSWYPQAYARMNALQAEILAVPSFGHGGLKAWTQPWQGYDGWPNPPDVDPKDVNTITNSEAWIKYSLATRINKASANYGINVFLHGNLWPDLDAGGGVAVVARKGDLWNREIATDNATLDNLWL